MKRKISLVLVFSMILSMSVSMSAFAAKNSTDNFKKTKSYQNQFTDVGTSEWYANSVSQAYEYGLVSGNSETSYNPTGNVSIAETIVLACRLNNIYCENNEKFENGEVWYQPYVDYAIKNKIIDKAYTDYNASATRREFAKILSNSLPKDVFEAINNVTVIPDVDDGEDNIYMLYNAGILAGNDKYGTFNPTSNIQRSEVAAIIVRIADKKQRKEFELEQKPVEIESISLNKTSLSMTAGDKETIKATISPDNATEKSIAYTSSNTNVASVSSNGEIKALSQGNTTIIATSSNGKKAECKITVAAAPIEFSGHGDKVINNVNIPFGSYYAELTHNGDRNFISKLYYGEKSYDYFRLSNEIGTCSLQVALYDNGNAAVNNGMIEVKADGDWTIKIKPVTGTTTTNVKGNGEIVTGLFTAKSSRTSVNLSHTGKSNFIAKVIKYNGTKRYDYESLSNEIGNYSGQTVVELTPGAQYYFYVRADGNWSIDFGEGESVTTYTLPKVSASNNSYDENDNDYDDSDYDSDDGDDKKFSYTDAEKLNKYSAASTKACNNATNEALSAAKQGNATMKSLYVAKALNYASSAKNNMSYAINILENRVDLTFESGDTLLDKANEAYDAINDILDFDAETDDVDDLMNLCMKAATKSLVVQKASVDLMEAFTK